MWVNIYWVCCLFLWGYLLYKLHTSNKKSILRLEELRRKHSYILKQEKIKKGKKGVCDVF